MSSSLHVTPALTQGNNGQSALHVAAAGGHLDACAHLIQCGSDALAEDRCGLKPHEIARENRHFTTMDFLMDPYHGIQMPGLPQPGVWK